MTFIMGVHGADWIWMLADRRLTYSNGAVKDNANKLLRIDTKDGIALIGYAGLGSTGRTEPSEWMARTIRGLNLPMEQTLNVLAESARKKLPYHLSKISKKKINAHTIVVHAFVNDEPRLYTIDVFEFKSKSALQYKRHSIDINNVPKGTVIPRISLGGSGSEHLPNNNWHKTLLTIVKAHDAGKISPQAVAKIFAKINFEVSQKDKFVSKECIVVWRHKNNGSGGSQNYSGLTEDNRSLFKSIPTMSQGTDINALIDTIFPNFIKIDDSIIDNELAKLPETPDDTLV